MKVTGRESKTIEEEKFWYKMTVWNILAIAVSVSWRLIEAISRWYFPPKLVAKLSPFSKDNDQATAEQSISVRLSMPCCRSPPWTWKSFGRLYKGSHANFSVFWPRIRDQTSSSIDLSSRLFDFSKQNSQICKSFFFLRFEMWKIFWSIRYGKKWSRSYVAASYGNLLCFQDCEVTFVFLSETVYFLQTNSLVTALLCVKHWRGCNFFRDRVNQYIDARGRHYDVNMKDKIMISWCI